MKLRWMLTLCLLTPLAHSQAARDPTQPPEALRSVAAASGVAGTSEPGRVQVQQIMVQNGRPYAVVAARRYGLGARLGDERIEKINEQSVWLRHSSGSLRRLDLYSGVSKRPATAPREEKQ